MADINHSKTPNLSIDSLDGSGASVPSLTVASSASLLVNGIAAFTGAESHSGAFGVTGPITSSSTNTFSGSNAFTGTMTLGTAGSSFVGLRRSTVSVALGTVAFDSVTSSAALSGITVGDPVLHIEPASLWSGAYYDIGVTASCVSWGAVQFAARNSTNTAINTTAMNFTITWLDLA